MSGTEKEAIVSSSATFCSGNKSNCKWESQMKWKNVCEHQEGFNEMLYATKSSSHVQPVQLSLKPLY